MSREAPFGATKKDVESFNSFGLSQEQKQGALEALGGLGGLCESLKTDDRAGLSDAEAASAARIAWFGANRMPAPEEETWWELFVAAFDDATVIVLCVAAAVSLAVGLYDDPAKGWIEGAAILAAVLVVAVVTATNDYQKQIQFRALNAAKDDVPVKVVRGGRGAALSTLDLVVGDLVRLETGDKVPADCVLARVEGADVSCDESSLTGETDDVDKGADTDPFLLSGCALTAGNCFAVVVAVGEESQWGRIKAKLADKPQDTPLQEKLDDLAKLIGYVGLFAAIMTFGAMMALWLALATEVPTHEILERRPYVRDAPLVGRVMVRNVAFQATFQLGVLCALLTPEACAFFEAGVPGETLHLTLIFNAFVFCQVFNEFNARSLFNDVNVVAGLHSNPVFVGVIVFTVLLQVAIVQYGGDFAKTRPLNEFQWAATVAIGFASMPVGLVMRSFPPFKEAEDSFAKALKRGGKAGGDDDALDVDGDDAMAWVSAAFQAFFVLAVPVAAFVAHRADLVGDAFSFFSS